MLSLRGCCDPAPSRVTSSAAAASGSQRSPDPLRKADRGVRTLAQQKVTSPIGGRTRPRAGQRQAIARWGDGGSSSSSSTQTCWPRQVSWESHTHECTCISPTHTHTHPSAQGGEHKALSKVSWPQRRRAGRRRGVGTLKTEERVGGGHVLKAPVPVIPSAKLKPRGTAAAARRRAYGEVVAGP